MQVQGPGCTSDDAHSYDPRGVEWPLHTAQAIFPGPRAARSSCALYSFGGLRSAAKWVGDRQPCPKFGSWAPLRSRLHEKCNVSRRHHLSWCVSGASRQNDSLCVGILIFPGPCATLKFTSKAPQPSPNPGPVPKSSFYYLFVCLFVCLYLNRSTN